MQLGSKVLPLPYIILYLAQQCVGPTREGTIDAKAITQTSHLRPTNDLGISRYAPLAQLGEPRSNPHAIVHARQHQQRKEKSSIG